MATTAPLEGSDPKLVPDLPRDRVRAFLRWINNTSHPDRPFVFERREVELLTAYVGSVIQLVMKRAVVDKHGVVTATALSAAFEDWCVEQSIRLDALEAFRATIASL